MPQVQIDRDLFIKLCEYLDCDKKHPRDTSEQAEWLRSQLDDKIEKLYRHEEYTKKHRRNGGI